MDYGLNYQSVTDAQSQGQVPGATIVGEGGQCAFCLQEYQDRVVLVSCSHAFCMECIMEWSKITLDCPLCKARYIELRQESDNVVPMRRIGYYDVEHDEDYTECTSCFGIKYPYQKPHVNYDYSAHRPSNQNAVDDGNDEESDEEFDEDSDDEIDGSEGSARTRGTSFTSAGGDTVDNDARGSGDINEEIDIDQN